MSRHWIADAIERGLEELDVDEVLAETAKHVTTKGEWEKGVVSPSLISTTCQLARLKKFLGHPPIPGKPTHIAGRAGRPDAISGINMMRGFFAEGMLVVALKQGAPNRVIAHAPLFAPRYVDEYTGAVHTGHPDVLVVGEEGEPELIQMKCPSVFKLDRVDRFGDEDALKNYRTQMIDEMFISRNAQTIANGNERVISTEQLQVVRNNLVLFTWEHTPKLSHPRIKVVELPWEEDMVTIPLAAADELEQDAARALAMGIWPEPYPEHQWDTWPCSYCQYSRLGDYIDPKNILPKCDDHAAWEAK